MHTDLILTNGTIYTLETDKPRAGAVLVRDGRVAALGDDHEMRDLAGRGSRVVNLDGQCVIPGLVDAHVHFRNFALSLRQIDVFEVPSLETALERVAQAARTTPKGNWLTGRGWTQELWAGRRFPNAAALDSVAPDHPVYLRHKSGHAGWANSAALRLAGIDAETPDPPGGALLRNESNAPTGILLEDAMRLVSRIIPPPTVPDIADAMRQAQQHCWEVGLVGLHDFDGRDSFQALQELRLNGELRLRVLKNIPAPRIEHAVGVGLRSGFGDEWLRIGGVKIFADGALGPRTALMLAPYEGEPDNFGIAVTEKEEMVRIGLEARRHGLSLTIHAIGDRAVHDVLDVYETVQAEPTPLAPRLRNRIEHVQIIHPADRQRLAQLDVIASMQPTHATSDMEMADRYWGDRARYSYAARTMLDSGATLVFGSDCPIEPIAPLPGIHAAVTRRRADGTPGPNGWYPEQRLSVTEAVRAFTLGAAETSGQTATQGSIAPGKWADFTLLDRDIFTVAPDEILETSITGTIIGGEFRYRTF